MLLSFPEQYKTAEQYQNEMSQLREQYQYNISQPEQYQNNMSQPESENPNYHDALSRKRETKTEKSASSASATSWRKPVLSELMAYHKTAYQY